MKQGRKQKSKRPVYKSDGEESDSLPKPAAVRKYRDDGNEDYYDERMEYVI